MNIKVWSYINNCIKFYSFVFGLTCICSFFSYFSFNNIKIDPKIINEQSKQETQRKEEKKKKNDKKENVTAVLETKAGDRDNRGKRKDNNNAIGQKSVNREDKWDEKHKDRVPVGL
jgi:hypothetical protein